MSDTNKSIAYCNWVYILSETSPFMLYTVGFYDPAGAWHSDSDYNDRGEAAERVAHLNGNKPANNNNLY